MKKEETWQEVQRVMNYFHGPIRTAAIGAQNWTDTSWLLLTSMAGLKSVAKDSSIEKRHQLITSGIADILHSVVGGWIIWQAYNLNETGGSTTPIPTTTEADLPPFPPLPSNDVQLFAIAEQLTDAAVNNELTPEMISVALNKAFIGVNGVIKVVSGVSGFDLYKVQRVTKVIEYLKSLSSFVTAGLNATHSNATGASLMAISGIMDFSQTYLSTTNKSNANNSPANNDTNAKIIITITTDREEKVITFPLCKGKLYYQDVIKVCKYLENNDWDVFKIENSDQTVDGFIKRGKMKHVEPTLNKFKEWIDNYTPQNKKITVVGEGNDATGERLKKLQVPMYEFEPEVAEAANNHDIPEVVVGLSESSPLIQF